MRFNAGFVWAFRTLKRHLAISAITEQHASLRKKVQGGQKSTRLWACPGSTDAHAPGEQNCSRGGWCAPRGSHAARLQPLLARGPLRGGEKSTRRGEMRARSRDAAQEIGTASISCSWRYWKHRAASPDVDVGAKYEKRKCVARWLAGARTLCKGVAVATQVRARAGAGGLAHLIL